MVTRRRGGREVGKIRGSRRAVSSAVSAGRRAITGIIVSCVLGAGNLPADTLARWKFEEGSLGSDVAAGENRVPDASGNGNHLRAWSAGTAPTYLNDTPFDPLPLTGAGNTRALNFTPNRDLYTEGKPLNGFRFGEWTIEVSFKPHVTDRWQVVLGKDGNPIGSPPPVSLKVLASSGRLELGLVDGAGRWRVVASQEPLQRGEWYSVAGVATATQMALWLKGPGDEDYVLQGTAGIAGAFFEYPGFSRSWTVGRGMWTGDLTDWFDGVIDEVRISDVALDPHRFLAAPRVPTDPAGLGARGVVAERMENGETRPYLALESAQLVRPERFRLRASPDLATWEEVPFTIEAGDGGGDRVRLVSDIGLQEHDRYFLRADVLQPGPGTLPQNPVLPGADPDALLVGDTAWIYPTYRGGSGRFFAFSSTDLVTWRIHGPILRFADVDWIPAGKQAWAPGVTENGGTFYLYYSAGPKPSYIGVAVADSPAGPFVDSGAPLLFDDGDPGFEAIDAMVFTDPQSGQSYLYAGGSAGARLRMWRLNTDMVSLGDEIAVATPPNFTEGAFLHYRDGIYYLSYSHGIWWDGSYEVHYATASTPHGPWAYRGPILVSDENHRGPGHHSILFNQGAGAWYIVYHRWNDETEPGPYEGRRKVAIDLLEYDARGLIKPVAMTNDGVGPVSLGSAD